MAARIERRVPTIPPIHPPRPSFRSPFSVVPMGTRTGGTSDDPEGARASLGTSSSVLKCTWGDRIQSCSAAVDGRTFATKDFFGCRKGLFSDYFDKKKLSQKFHESFFFCIGKHEKSYCYRTYHAIVNQKISLATMSSILNSLPF